MEPMAASWQLLVQIGQLEAPSLGGFRLGWVMQHLPQHLLITGCKSLDVCYLQSFLNHSAPGQGTGPCQAPTMDWA